MLRTGGPGGGMLRRTGGGLGAGRGVRPGPPKPPPSTYRVGEKVMVWRRDLLFEAEVTEVTHDPETHGRAYTVHYVGWHSSWDETVTSERIVPFSAAVYVRAQMQLKRLISTRREQAGTTWNPFGPQRPRKMYFKGCGKANRREGNTRPSRRPVRAPPRQRGSGSHTGAHATTTTGTTTTGTTSTASKPRKQRPSAPKPGPGPLQPAGGHGDGACEHCGTTNSPLWRRVNSWKVCNACGLYYKANGRFRALET